jgi:hypothetical protein
MTFPPIEYADLVALGMSPDAIITSEGGVTVDPPANWLATRVISSAMSSTPPQDRPGYCRHVRDLVLAATDWTQAADSPLAETQRAAWAAYRQALRDLPSVYSGEGPIPWPVAP